MMPKLRIGVAGAGAIGRKHIELIAVLLAGRETPLISVEDAMGTLAVVEAVRQAARTGTRVSPGHIVEQAA